MRPFPFFIVQGNEGHLLKAIQTWKLRIEEYLLIDHLTFCDCHSKKKTVALYLITNSAGVHAMAGAGARPRVPEGAVTERLHAVQLGHFQILVQVTVVCWTRLKI